ncbi:MAG TPA: hypothetical protein VH763_01175 [Gemmatimonadales bacterium]
MAGLCAAAVTAHPPTVAARTLTVTVAKPKPAAKRNFRLFARALGAFTVNRVLCGLNSDGEVCVDSTNSSTIGGGFWPKGTADQYVFNSGLQIAGIIGSDANPEWQGDTTGAFFFDPKGTTQHGEQVEPIYNTNNADDLAFISDPAASDPAALAARVPSGDATADLYNPLLRGRSAASQADVWWMSWDGNPALNAGRAHPLGIAVEQRGLGWNFPVGNEDIAYFVYTFYNVTAKDPAVYTAAGARPGMADILARQGDEFQTKNEQAFGISIPDGGYTVNNLFAAFSADMDVAEATVNYSSVNVPFALGYVYAHDFTGATGWTFDPSIFSPPFFPGSGFVGVKYLKSPVVNGQEVGLTLFSNTINGGAFDDAQNTIQLYRYLSNNISTAAGDAACNTGNPQQTHICFVNTTAPDDMRFFQSSGPLNLGPGQFGSIVVAYIFAAPALTGSCTGPGTCDLNPGDPRRLLTPSVLATGANAVDSVTGYRGFRGADPNGAVVQDSINTLPGSLLGKALVAQAVFNNGFLLPFAPDAPDFFLIPGDNQVTVLWRPSASEASGDPFFATASSLFTPEGAPNPLYDPNYRQFDVEGYRIYRGRVDSPNQLSLVASFDYAGTTITDFQGQVNPVAGCAPELGINTITTAPDPDDPTVIDTTFGCPAPFDSLPPEGGVAPTVSVQVPLVGDIIQVKKGERTKLATGDAIILHADTLRGLNDTGVPFTFVDRGVRSNLRYFYSVTAFDVNSFQSGPSSIESPRSTKPVIPVAGATNLQSTAILTPFIEGRGVNVSQDSTLPSIDPTTGIFSGKFPAANNAAVEFVGQFVQTIFAGEGDVTATLIGLGLGDARNGVPVNYTYQTSSSTGTLDTISVSVAQPIDLSNQVTGSAPFPAATADAALSSRFGVPPGFVQSGQVTQGIAGYQVMTGFGRGCFIDGLFNDTNCAYNGPRWFAGDNETKADPNAGNVGGSGDATDNNNAGELPGVLTIQNPQSYTQMSGAYRQVDAFTAGGVRAADYKVYWGAAGKVDSVIDVTHNVPVPFIADSIGGGWGFLTQAGTTGAGSGDGRPDVLTLQDFGCVFPFSDPNRQPDQTFACAGAAYLLTDTAVPGAIAIYGGAPTGGATAPPRPNPGFGMWLAGHIFMFELAPGSGVPASGTVWTMRSYIGFVSGGNGAAGALGSYSFTAQPRSFSALGASLKLHFASTTALVEASKNDLSRVHTVPDPYYVTNQFEQTTNTKILKFVNLPADAIVRIYSSSGVLVALLEHHSDTFGGEEDWNLRNRNNQVVASGVYFYHVEAGAARRVGRFTVVNFAQ